MSNASDGGRYYVDLLAASRLEECYRIAPPRVQQYLEAEVDHVITRIRRGGRVLDLGCGYGRIMGRIAERAGQVIGVDISVGSLRKGLEPLRRASRVRFAAMHGLHLAFRPGVFDVAVCIQNGISAFHVDRRALMVESLRVVNPGGRVLFSTYAESFWPHRLHWFELQAEAGLIGPIDYDKTADGIIVCKDGFSATTVSTDDFLALTSRLPADVTIKEVDGSSLFCELVRH